MPKPVTQPNSATSAPQPVPTPSPAVHSKDWCGGPLADRLAMYSLAQQVCGRKGLKADMTEELLATIYGESGFNQWCENHKNTNGSADFGLCQFNNGTLHGQALWIGPGAAFSSTDEVLNTPEKCVEVMADQFKAGHQDYWIAHKSGGYKQWLGVKPH